MPLLPDVSWKMGEGKKSVKGGAPGHFTEVLHVIAWHVILSLEGKVMFQEGAARVTETAEVNPLREDRREWF